MNPFVLVRRDRHEPRLWKHKRFVVEAFARQQVAELFVIGLPAGVQYFITLDELLVELAPSVGRNAEDVDTRVVDQLLEIFGFISLVW
jgi:hypothetical protein